MATIQRKLKHGSKYNDPSIIVVHSMGEFILDPGPIHAVDFLRGYGLSAHALVDPNGDIYECRSTSQGAWHARGYNKDSLGIEFLVRGEHNYQTFIDTIREPGWATEEQWLSGIEVVKQWITDFNIRKIVRHSDISPGRKVDPGEGFNWTSFEMLIQGK